MHRAKQGTRNAGYRQVTLLDRRGRVLAYADSLAVSDRTVGLARASFSPTGIVRLSMGRERVTVTSGGRVVRVLNGFRLTIHTGGQRSGDGSWTCEAAIGTISRSQGRSV
ncbi:MAG TPA: hypothetical protein VFH67_03960 [bacterium]|nr:hypothetical protein [bacterium]